MRPGRLELPPRLHRTRPSTLGHGCTCGSIPRLAYFLSTGLDVLEASDEMFVASLLSRRRSSGRSVVRPGWGSAWRIAGSWGFTSGCAVCVRPTPKGPPHSLAEREPARINQRYRTSSRAAMRSVARPATARRGKPGAAAPVFASSRRARCRPGKSCVASAVAPFAHRGSPARRRPRCRRSAARARRRRRARPATTPARRSSRARRWSTDTSADLPGSIATTSRSPGISLSSRPGDIPPSR